jgi:hypothetical protein
MQQANRPGFDYGGASQIHSVANRRSLVRDVDELASEEAE